MTENEEKTKNKSRNNSEKVDMEIMLNDSNEYYHLMENQKLKPDAPGKKNAILNLEESKNEDDSISIPRKRRRTNSVDLYKKHKKEKEKEKEKKLNKESNKNLKLSSKNIKESNSINNSASIYASPKNEDNNIKIVKKSSKFLKNGKIKKVTFPKNFVSIVDVESYKKYNEENTCKDPFEDAEFMKNINNIINNNKNDEEDGKARATCSCIIF